jgi:hypothetical protein
MSNPNINTSMMGWDRLIEYRNCLASQLPELLNYRHDALQDL